MSTQAAIPVVYLFFCAIMFTLLVESARATSHPIIGQAEYCAISPREVLCVDHTMMQCLRTVSLMPTGTGCCKREEL